jgi:hypothetical protein
MVPDGAREQALAPRALVGRQFVRELLQQPVDPPGFAQPAREELDGKCPPVGGLQVPGRWRHPADETQFDIARQSPLN